MFVLFIVLIVGPSIASRFLTSLPSVPLQLVQPTGLNNNDTSDTPTGTAAGAAGGATGTSTADSTGFRRAFMEYAF